MENKCTTNTDRRLANIEGHVKAIRKMVAEGRECEEILTQMQAVESAMHNVATLILKNHLDHCVKEGIENGDGEVLERFSRLLDRYL